MLSRAASDSRWTSATSEKCLPFKSRLIPGGEKKVARSEVKWDATTILFLATSEAFYWHCRGSMRIAGGPWQYFGWRFYTMFSAVGEALVSLHSITEGVLWRGLTFQTCVNIINNFFLIWEFLCPSSYVAVKQSTLTISSPPLYINCMEFVCSSCLLR